tara:strand:- start:488 stop:634 length:147 start_codon:yes stop_codon:yes gene_type:complete
MSDREHTVLAMNPAVPPVRWNQPNKKHLFTKKREIKISSFADKQTLST